MGGAMVLMGLLTLGMTVVLGFALRSSFVLWAPGGGDSNGPGGGGGGGGRPPAPEPPVPGGGSMTTPHRDRRVNRCRGARARLAAHRGGTRRETIRLG